MVDPFAELLRADGSEVFAELYELIAEIVAETENAEGSSNAEYPPGSYQDQLITLFNACESARLEFRNRIAAMATNGDDEPAELTGRGGLRR